jgi:diadenylate cyclase
MDFLSNALYIFKILLDVFVVAYVFYRFLLLSKGTRALQIFVFLVGFLGLLAVSQPSALDLVTFRWLLDKLYTVMLVVIVILYQDDIRRSLSRLRWLEFALKDRGLTPTRSMEELVRAVRTLSSKRIGALIAIERSGNLEPYVAESGIRVDGFVSKELLFALFLPSHENPTHDGAVIVVKDRVHSAGCILPLTSRTDLEAWVGTRHRAGLGLSERVDAVLIIVSEETGRISVAVDGELKAGLSPDELRHMLSSEIGTGHQRSVLDRLKDLARRRGGKKNP